MQAHRHEPLQPVGLSRPRCAAATRAGSPQLVGRLQRRLELAEEHRAVDREVVVVAAVDGVEVVRAREREVAAVGARGGLVPDHHVAVVAAQHVDVGRHVHEVAGVGDERRAAGRPPAAPAPGRATSPSRGRTCAAGPDAGGAATAMPRSSAAIASAVSAPSAGVPVEVPQLPWRPVHQRLGEQRRHVGVVRVLGVDGAHRVGVGHRSRPCSPRPARPRDGARRARRSAPARPAWRTRPARRALGDGVVTGGHGSVSSSPVKASHFLL